METTKEIVVEALVSALPYANQITNWDLSKDDRLNFDWRGNTFDIQFESLSVYEITGGSCVGSDLAMLLRTLLEREIVRLKSE